MTTYVVTYSHPDEVGWNENVGPHVDWLIAEIEAGRLRASGPFVETPARSAMLIVDVDDRAALDAMIATDPFSKEGLIADLTVTEWDPMFGAFASPLVQQEE